MAYGLDTGMSYEEAARMANETWRLDQLAQQSELQKRMQGTIRDPSGGSASLSIKKNKNSPNGMPVYQGGSTNYQQAQFDPWSKYRGAAGDKLWQMAQGDPSNDFQSKLMAMMSNGNGGFTTSDPSYQFRFDQGQKALERSLAAKGLLNSGNAAIELQQYGQGMASQEFGAQFQRLLGGMQGISQQYDTQMQRMMKMAGIDLDPTGAAKMNIAQQQANISGQDMMNRYSLGLLEDATRRYTADLSAQTQRAGSRSTTIDTSSMYSAKAKSDVESANWWADKKQSDMMWSSGGGTALTPYKRADGSTFY